MVVFPAELRVGPELMESLPKKRVELGVTPKAVRRFKMESSISNEPFEALPAVVPFKSKKRTSLLLQRAKAFGFSKRRGNSVRSSFPYVRRL